MIRYTILYLVTVGFVSSQPPERFDLFRADSESSFDTVSTSGFSSNSIRHIRKANGTDILFIATSDGLGFIDNSGSNRQYGMFDRTLLELPAGGNPGLDVRGQDIAVSGVLQVETPTGIEPAGTGIGYSSDGGQSWQFKPQPVDSLDSPLFITFPWGEPGFEQEIRKLSNPTVIDNVSYDVTIMGDYIYAANWAGGVQRFQFKNISPAIDEDPNPWQPLPLPMDDQLELNCGLIDTDEYVLNPRDPQNGGNHNHKGFAVHAVGDTLWAGTANGINKGVLLPGGCINWRHYTAYSDGLSGNWVIGFADQQLTNDNNLPFQRVWAITWSTGGNENYGLSYTDNGGYSWNVADQLTTMNLRIYGISTYDDWVIIASDEGVYLSMDGTHWEKMSHPAENQGEILLSDSMFSCLYDQDSMEIWVGSPDGLATTNNLGQDWEVIRFWISTANTAGSSDRFYAYPNPMYTGSYNGVNSENYVRFVFDPPNASPARLTVFDFSMAKVAELNHAYIAADEQEFLWDCRNDWGDRVANGVYFCRLKTGGKSQWTKVVVIND